MNIKKFLSGIFNEFVLPILIFTGAFSFFLAISYTIGTIFLFFDFEPQLTMLVFGSKALSVGLLSLCVAIIFGSIVFRVSMVVFEFIKTMKKIVKNAKENTKD